MEEILAQFDMEVIIGAFAGGIAAAIVLAGNFILAKIKEFVLGTETKIDDQILEAIILEVEERMKAEKDEDA